VVRDYYKCRIQREYLGKREYDKQSLDKQSTNQSTEQSTEIVLRYIDIRLCIFWIKTIIYLKIKIKILFTALKLY